MSRRCRKHVHLPFTHISSSIILYSIILYSTTAPPNNSLHLSQHHPNLRIQLDSLRKQIHTTPTLQLCALVPTRRKLLPRELHIPHPFQNPIIITMLRISLLGYRCLNGARYWNRASCWSVAGADAVALKFWGLLGVADFEICWT